MSRDKIAKVIEELNKKLSEVFDVRKNGVKIEILASRNGSTRGIVKAIGNVVYISVDSLYLGQIKDLFNGYKSLGTKDMNGMTVHEYEINGNPIGVAYEVRR